MESEVPVPAPKTAPPVANPLGSGMSLIVTLTPGILLATQFQAEISPLFRTVLIRNLIGALNTASRPPQSSEIPVLKPEKTPRSTPEAPKIRPIASRTR